MNLRFEPLLEVLDVPEDNRRREVPLNESLLERNNLGREEVLKGEPQLSLRAD